MRLSGRVLATVPMAVVLVGCGGGADLPPGVDAVVATGLDGPTQAIVAPDGTGLWVAQLAGGERDGSGQVVPVDPASGDVGEALVTDLVTPTGIAVAGDALWIQEPTRVLRAPLGADGLPGPPDAVVVDLPNNGRSQGSITVLADGGLLVETSGTGSGPDPNPDSGRLWTLDPTAPEPALEAFASGFKGAYGHAPAADGRVWVTEVVDGSYDGEPGPDELDLVAAGDDGGWPDCIGDRAPTTSFGVTEQDCEATLSPVALFDPGATPTSVVEVDGRPWVALWVQGRVVRVDDGGAVVDVATDLDGPLHLLVVDDEVLVTEHNTGRILRLAMP